MATGVEIRPPPATKSAPAPLLLAPQTRCLALGARDGDAATRTGCVRQRPLEQPALARALHRLADEVDVSKKASRVLVVGVDFEVCGDDAIAEGLRLVAQGSADQLHAVFVLDPDQRFDDPSAHALWTTENVLERAPHALRERVAEVARASSLALPQTPIQTHTRIGKPLDTLLQVAVDYNADLIVVGTHARRGVDRFLLGSVAERLVRAATCPVLVARPKDHTGRAKTQLPDPPYAPGEQPVASAPPIDRPAHISTEAGTGLPTGIRIV